MKPYISMCDRETTVAEYELVGYVIRDAEVVIRGNTKDIHSPDAKVAMKCRLRVFHFVEGYRPVKKNLVADIDLEKQTLMWHGEELKVLNKEDFFKQIAEKMNG